MNSLVIIQMQVNHHLLIYVETMNNILKPINTRACLHSVVHEDAKLHIVSIDHI